MDDTSSLRPRTRPANHSWGGRDQPYAVLDRAARAQARALRFALTLPQLDTCAMAADWRRFGLSRTAAARALDFPLDVIPFASAAEDSVEWHGSAQAEVDLG